MSSQERIVENHLERDKLDLVVGIPSYNEADNIAFVANQAAQGLKKYFPDLASAVVNADNFSEDGTREVFLKCQTYDIPKTYLSTPAGVKGKGNNFFNLFRYLAPYEPEALVVVDADLKSIQPEWVKALAQPVLDGYGFVSPSYSRNEYDGTITNHLCYPLLYGLLGKDIRQPIGGDFAFSGELQRHWLTKDWTDSIRQYGVDIFMTLEAVLADFELAQVSLGAKIHKPSAPKLGKMFTQVVDTLFGKLNESRRFWMLNGDRPSAPPLFNGQGLIGEPQDLGIDYKALKRQALEEFETKWSIAREILDEKQREEIGEMIQKERFGIRRTAWAAVVFKFLGAYGRAGSDSRRLEIVEALKPLYFARIVSFIKETLELDHGDSEERIVRQAKAFWRNRRVVLN